MASAKVISMDAAVAVILSDISMELNDILGRPHCFVSLLNGFGKISLDSLGAQGGTLRLMSNLLFPNAFNRLFTR